MQNYYTAQIEVALKTQLGFSWVNVHASTCRLKNINIMLAHYYVHTYVALWLQKEES